MTEKVYVIYEGYNWNDDSTFNIVAVSDDISIAKKIFKDHIEKTKNIIDFSNLEVTEENDRFKNYDDAKYLYEETEDTFLIYLNGDYTNNHIYVNLSERSIIRELEEDKSQEL